MKYTLVIIGFLLTATCAFAQVKVRPGLRLGLNISNISNSTLDDKIGPNAAVFADIRLASFYALQPELVYSRQGGKSTIQNTEDLQVDYLSIGLSSKFYLIPNQGLHLFFGPSLDFDFENNIINLINDNNDSDVTPFDFSLFFGIGYEFDFGLILEARYKQGLLDIDLFNDDFNSDFYDGEGNTFNTVFQFGVAYKFDF